MGKFRPVAGIGIAWKLRSCQCKLAKFISGNRIPAAESIRLLFTLRLCVMLYVASSCVVRPDEELHTRWSKA
jgi:hypothetical protein